MMTVNSISYSRIVWRSFSLLFLLSLVSFFFVGCGSQKTIVNGLDEREANEIIVFLSTKGIDANKVPAKTSGVGGGGGTFYDITVDASRYTEAMALLNMNGLPRRRGQNLLGIFQAGGLVPSDTEERIRYQAGLAEQIASTIRKIDGILDADVQLSFPEEDPLNPGKKIGKVTASVYVKHNGVLDDPNSHLLTKIKRLVASSVPDLDFDNVTVIADRARFSDISLPALQGTVAEEKKDYVTLWSMVIGKESVGRFQLVVFSLVFFILVLVLVIILLLWKLAPLIRQAGGFTHFFDLSSILPARFSKGKKEPPAAKGPEEAEAAPGEQPKPPKGKEEKKEDENDQTPEAS